MAQHLEGYDSGERLYMLHAIPRKCALNDCTCVAQAQPKYNLQTQRKSGGAVVSHGCNHVPRVYICHISMLRMQKGVYVWEKHAY